MKLFESQKQLLTNYFKELNRLEEVRENNIEKIYESFLILSSISADEAVEKLERVNKNFYERQNTIELNYAQANMKVRGA